LREAAETCAQGIEHHRHTLDLILADRPVYVDADAGRLLQVVCNLLNNAVKYMRDGGRIQLAVSRADGAAAIRVRDEGVGIPPHMLEEIFNRFVQLGASQERSEGGLGIGLSLVKALVDLHGGTVTARSDGIGTGSEFIVRLPLAPD
jgi:signal transduction histidine kinase